MTLRASPRVAAPTPTPELAQGAWAPPVAPAPAPAPAPAEARCARCGARNPADSRFCHDCGNPMHAPAPDGAAAARAGAPPAPLQAPAPPPQPVLHPPAAPPAAPARPIPPATQINAAPVVNTAPLSSAPQLAPAPPSPTAPSGHDKATVCARCRGIADPGADFCKFCGARLHASGPAAAPAAPSLPDHAPAAAAPAAHPSTVPPAHADPSGERAVARLVRIEKDGSEGQTFFVRETADIGRQEGTIVLPDDPYLSPRHARLLVKRNAVSILDLESTNGVYLRLRGPHPLRHGDLLLVGQQVLRFETVTDMEGARGPAMQHGVLLFGSPAPQVRARLVQRTVEGLARDIMYLVRDEFVLGRENGDRTYPDDIFLSRRHMTVRKEGNGFVAHDLGSSNGSFVQLRGEHQLSHGDHFRVGHHLFRVELLAPGGAA